MNLLYHRMGLQPDYHRLLPSSTLSEGYIIHMFDPGHVRFSNLDSWLLLMVGQNRSRLIHERIGAFDGRPQRLSALECLAENLPEMLQCGRKTFFCSTRAMESLIWVSRSCNLRPDASKGARPSSVSALRTARQ